MREVETVYDSILANLQQQPDLKQSDVAVLATDMEVYRPILQCVFERRERRLHYNLSDFSAAGVSIFGQALIGMLDLALDAFTRSRVLAVLLNPCFLARLGIDEPGSGVARLGAGTRHLSELGPGGQKGARLCRFAAVRLAAGAPAAAAGANHGSGPG